MRAIPFFAAMAALTFLCCPARAGALTLAEGLSIVTASGRAVRVAEAEHRAAVERRTVARSGWLPRVDASVENTWLDQRPEASFGFPGSVPIADQRSLAWSVRLEQRVFDLGETGARMETAEAVETASGEHLRRTVQQSALRFIRAYLGLLAAGRAVDLAERDVGRLGAHIREAEAMYREGLVLKNDLLEARVVLSTAESALVAAEGRRATRRAEVNTALMRAVTLPVDPVEVEPLVRIDPGVLDEELLEAELRSRPDVAAALAERDQARAAVRLARSEYGPRAFLDGGYAFEENSNMLHEGQWFLTARLGMNLYAGGATAARVAEAEARLRKAEAGLSAVKERARFEIEAARQALLTARRRLDVTRDAVEQAEENLRLARLRYREGEGTSTQVLDADTRLAETEVRRADAGYAALSAEAELLYALGRDLRQIYAAGETNLEEHHD